MKLTESSSVGIEFERFARVKGDIFLPFVKEKVPVNRGFTVLRHSKQTEWDCPEVPHDQLNGPHVIG